jgi:hypothetical protein
VSKTGDIRSVQFLSLCQLFSTVAKNLRNNFTHFERKREVERNAANLFFLKPKKTENGYELITSFTQNHEAGTEVLQAKRRADINLIRAICNPLFANAF